MRNVENIRIVNLFNLAIVNYGLRSDSAEIGGEEFLLVEASVSCCNRKVGFAFADCPVKPFMFQLGFDISCRFDIEFESSFVLI